LRRPDKEQYVEDLTSKIKESDAVFLADYQGLTFPQISEIRAAVKSSGSDFKVVKNTLLKIALHNSDITGLDDFLKGPTTCTIVKGDVAAAAKELKKYSKEFDKFSVRAGMLDGNVLSADDVSTLADLPSREELLAKMLSTFNAPVTNFVSLLGNIPRSLLNVLTAIKDKKES